MGTELSMVPCMMRNGGQLFEMYLIGLAFSAFSLLSWIGPPISFPSGEPASLCFSALRGPDCASICNKSVGPYQSQTA